MTTVVQTATAVAPATTTNTTSTGSVSGGVATRHGVKWESSEMYHYNPYAANGPVTQESARMVGLCNVETIIESFNCGGRTHLHITIADGERLSYTFSGRNETTGVLKLVGRVALKVEERIVTQDCSTAPGKWRNAAIRTLVQDMLSTGTLRIACVKVSATSIEYLLTEHERPIFSKGMRLPTFRLGSKNELA